jgi:hypothetical protein
MNKPGFLSLSPAAVPSSLLQKGVQLIFSMTEKKITDEGFIEGGPWRDPTKFLLFS